MLKNYHCANYRLKIHKHRNADIGHAFYKNSIMSHKQLNFRDTKKKKQKNAILKEKLLKLIAKRYETPDGLHTHQLVLT